MKPTKKSGKEGRAKGAGKKPAAGARPAKSGKQAAEDLRRSEEKYRDLFENAIDAICITDRDQNYLDVNRRAVELFGYSRDEFLSMNVRDMLPPGQIARSEKEFAKLIESGAYEKFTGQARRKDGSYIDIEVSSSAIVEQGQVIGSRDIIRDITERRKAEALLRESESRMRSIVESSPVGMHLYRLEPDGRLVFTGANPAADRILGVGNSVFIGKTIEEAFPPLKDTEIPERYRDVARFGKSWQTDNIEYQNGAIKGAFEVHAFQTAPNVMVAAFEDITARKRVEIALQQNEEKYRRLYNETPILLHSIDRSGIVVDVNDFWLKTMGYKRSEVIGRKVTDFYTSASKKYATEVVQPAFFRDGIVKNISFQFVKKNGEVADMVLSATAERDAAGNVIRSQAVIEDITERKRAEARINESEKKYRTLFESSNDGIFILDLDGNFIDANPAAYARLGYTKEELLSMNIGTLDTPEYADKIPGRLKQLREQGVAVFESANRRKDGSVMQIEVSAQQLDYEGRPVLFSVNRDITERKRAQEELAGQKTMLQEILDTSSVAIFLLDKAGRITKANRRMAEMFGRHLEAMAGMEYVELVHPSEREVGRAKMLALLASKIPSVDLERHYRRKDGTEFWGHLTGRRFHDVHGNELGLIGVISDITGRKRAEDKLKESEAWLNTILDNVGAYIFIKDTQYRYTYVNRKVCELFGMTPDDILGKGDDAFFSAASVEEVKRSDRPVIERGETVAREEFGLTPLSGMARTYWTVKLPLRDAGGAITGLCGISTDITEHKQAEVALRKSERMLQMIIDTEPDCIKLIDEESRLLMMNRAGLDMLQVDSLEQVKGQFVCPLVAPEYQQAFRDLTRRVFQGETGSLEFKMTGLQGRQVWLDTHAVPLRNEKEEVAALLGVTRDITERKNAEHALRQSEARFRAMIESASIGILVADIETRKFLYANPEICRLLGYSEQEFHSLSATDLAIPEELPDSIEGFQAHVEGQLKATERTFRRKDGSTVKMSINSVRMEFDGRPSLVGFFTDITEKLLLEEERLKAQKLESIGTLAGGIAHDFNNLLQGIFGYISMAKLTIDQREKSLAMLVQAEKALHQSVNLTSQLLTFSKGGKPVKKVIDLRTVIEDSVKFALSGSRVSYELSFGDDLCAVEADEGQIGQVVQNIILNAEQAMPLGGRIEIAARCVPPFQASGLALTAPDGLVEIVVRDQGTGIPPEHLPRIFDPYFTTKEKGSGLGLATAYSIVKNHDGMISVASELGKGSTFTIYLPATREVLGSAAASVSARCATGKKCRVLVMDDEPVVRVVAGELLRELGHEVEFAEHGDSAIEKYRRAKAEGRPFDAVILDLTIRGGKGGAEAMRELLAIDPGVKAIVSSGYSGDEVVATYRQHGFRAFLKKPYDMRELGRILDDVMA